MNFNLNSRALFPVIRPRTTAFTQFPLISQKEKNGGFAELVMPTLEIL